MKHYPAYTDPRAHHLFSIGYVGNGFGDVRPHECAKDREGGKSCSLCVRGGEARTNYSTYFDNMVENVEPTATIAESWQTHYCAYCGNRAHTLQYKNCDVRGYTCSCAGACDEREYVARREEMRERHHREVKEMEKTAPVQPKEVLVAVWERKSRAVLKEIGEGYVPSAFEQLGIIVGDVDDH